MGIENKPYQWVGHWKQPNWVCQIVVYVVMCSWQEIEKIYSMDFLNLKKLVKHELSACIVRQGGRVGGFKVCDTMWFNTLTTFVEKYLT